MNQNLKNLKLQQHFFQFSKPNDDAEIDQSQVNLVLSHYPIEFDFQSVKKVTHYKLLWADSLYFKFE